MTLLPALASAQTGSSVVDEYDPQAAPGAVVTCGNARFTVLTSRLVRMEWAEDAQFEDRATLAVVNRRLEVPSFRVQKSRNGVVITTKETAFTACGLWYPRILMRLFAVDVIPGAIIVRSP